MYSFVPFTVDQLSGLHLQRLLLHEEHQPVLRHHLPHHHRPRRRRHHRPLHCRRQPRQRTQKRLRLGLKNSLLWPLKTHTG